MAYDRHFYTAIFLYLGRESSDYDEIWCTDVHFDSQRAQNTAARLVFRLVPDDHVTVALHDLHCLAITDYLQTTASNQFCPCELCRVIVWISFIYYTYSSLVFYYFVF